MTQPRSEAACSPVPLDPLVGRDDDVDMMDVMRRARAGVFNHERIPAQWKTPKQRRGLAELRAGLSVEQQIDWGMYPA